MNVLFHADAETELEAAAIWYERQQVGLGVDFRNEANEAVNRLIGDSTTGSIAEGFASESGIRRVSLRRFPYTIVYTDKAVLDTIYVLAVMHQRRRPRYWQFRLEE